MYMMYKYNVFKFENFKHGYYDTIFLMCMHHDHSARGGGGGGGWTRDENAMKLPVQSFWISQYFSRVFCAYI